MKLLLLIVKFYQRAHSETVSITKPLSGADGCVLGAGVEAPAHSEHAVIVTPGVTPEQGVGQGALALIGQLLIKLSVL